MSELEDILEEYENGQNPHQSEEYRLNKAVKAIQAYTDRAVTDARIDELRMLAGKLAARKPKETWKDWSWRVTDEMKERLATLTISVRDGGETSSRREKT